VKLQVQYTVLISAVITDHLATTAEGDPSLAVEGEMSVVSVLVDVERVPGGAGLVTVRAPEPLGLQVLRLYTPQLMFPFNPLLVILF
jgi:hypothetical protein